MDWFRLHHGTCPDPKWRIVARRSKEPVSNVLAVWLAMLECASQSEPRGVLQNWNDEDVGMMLDLDQTQVHAIREAMQGKVLDGDKLTGWERRQPKKEDPNVTERVRRYRERNASGNDVKRDETPCNDMERPVTTEEIRGDKRRVEQADAPATDDKLSDAKAKGQKVIHIGMKCAEIIGWQKGDPTKTFNPIHQWLADGATEDVILATVKRVMEKRTGSVPNSLAYFTSAIGEAVEADKQRRSAEDRAVIDRNIQWNTRMRGYKTAGIWLGDWGPKPEDAGCYVPPDVLRQWGM